MVQYKNNKLLATARTLRKNMTPFEQKLWYGFLRKYPTRIYKQKIISSFIADFYCASAKLIIEVDGSQHYTSQGLAADNERSAILEARGIKVIRFTNDDVYNKFSSVCNAIDEVIKSRTTKIMKRASATLPL